MYIPGSETVNFVREQLLDPELGEPYAFRVGGPLGDNAKIEEAFGRDYIVAERKHLAGLVGTIATGVATIVSAATGHAEAAAGAGLTTAGLIEVSSFYGRLGIANRIEYYRHRNDPEIF